ncbi:unnamed protein product [Didymodactylos carnosus]|uniref:Uncharacterized protein n=1 Tax=Didymodactylos carnosus TaxID=1234261 RepID=A0A8S2UVF8_9BILA|nr:unnamed protein product [Didymodactylos carnosus]
MNQLDSKLVSVKSELSNMKQSQEQVQKELVLTKSMNDLLKQNTTVNQQVLDRNRSLTNIIHGPSTSIASYNTNLNNLTSLTATLLSASITPPANTATPTTTTIAWSQRLITQNQNL